MKGVLRLLLFSWALKFVLIAHDASHEVAFGFSAAMLGLVVLWEQI